MRLVISDPKTGKSYQTELSNDKEPIIVGKKIGETIDGGAVGAPGYMLELTGGSDTSGFPMRKDSSGTKKSHPLLTDGVGFHAESKGERRRKTVRGNSFSSEIMQINSIVKQSGATPLDQLFKKEE